MPLALPLGVPGGIAPAFIRASSWLSPAGVVPSSLGLSCLVGAGALRGGCCGSAGVLRESSRAANRLSIAARRDSSGSGGRFRYWVRAAVTRAVLVVPWAVAAVSSASSKASARRIVRLGIAGGVQRQDNGNPAPGPSPQVVALAVASPHVWRSWAISWGYRFWVHSSRKWRFCVQLYTTQASSKVDEGRRWPEVGRICQIIFLE